LLLAAIGDVHRFPSAKALRQWAGVMPRSHQSSHTQRLGLGMTKEGPARVKRLCIKQRITPGSGTQRWQPSTTGRWWSWARPTNRPWG
jgi:hypothetical protein